MICWMLNLKSNYCFVLKKSKFLLILLLNLILFRELLVPRLPLF